MISKFDAEDTARLHELRTRRAEDRKTAPHGRPAPLTIWQRAADQVAVTMGSWSFILLNLVLSFQAAYAAPVVMMSQNRQQDIDRGEAADGYQIYVRAELELELPHAKIDALREKEVLALTQAVHELTMLLHARGTDRTAP